MRHAPLKIKTVMKMGNFPGGAKAICPFYCKEAKFSITCESLIDGTISMQRFPTEEAKLKYQDQNCNVYEYYMKCPVAAILHWKYALLDEQEAN